MWYFIFDNIKGKVIDNGTYILWAGMSFQIEAANAELRAAIDAARI